MSPRTIRWMQLCTRVLSAAFIAFTALFALDVFNEHTRALDIMTNLMLHLIPTFILLIVFLLAWKREWVGGVGYIAIAFLYTIVTLRHPSWILVIAGPLYLLGILNCILWCSRRAQAPKEFYSSIK